MTGTDSISQVQVQTYEGDLKLRVQQMESRLSGCVSQDNFIGETLNLPYLGRASSREKVGRGTQTRQGNIQFTNRRVFSRTFTATEYVDRKDIAKVIVEPRGRIADAIVAEFYRVKDRRIVRAFEADVEVGKNGESVAKFDQNNIVDGSSKELDVELLRQCKRTLDRNDCDDMGRYIVMTSAQYYALLGDPNFTSTDFNPSYPLANGMGTAPYYLGFYLLRVEDVSVPLPRTTPNNQAGVRSCYFWQDRGMVYATDEANTIIRVEERNDLEYTWQVYGEMSGEAARVEEEMVGKLLVSEPAQA